MKPTPHLRMFAGPNGSGKSTIKTVVGSAVGADLLGVYINPDELEEEVRRSSTRDCGLRLKMGMTAESVSKAVDITQRRPFERGSVVTGWQLREASSSQKE